jgi:hypothetical protein
MVRTFCAATGTAMAVQIAAVAESAIKVFDGITILLTRNGIGPNNRASDAMFLGAPGA